METDKGKTVTFRGRRLSAADPRAGSIRKIPSPHKPRHAFIFVSPLHGYGLFDFLKSLPSSSAAFFLELEPNLSSIYSEPDCEVPEIVSAETPEAAFSSLRERFRLDVRYRGIRTLSIHRITAGYQLHREKYEELRDILLRDMQDVWRNRATEMVLGRRWLGNLFRNLVSVAGDTSALDLHRELREWVILIGAGPSLDHTLPEALSWIKAGRDLLTVAAIDTALPVLAEYDLKPDIVFAMDSQLANTSDFTPWRWDSVALVADATVHHAIPTHFHSSRRYWFVSQFAPIIPLDRYFSGGTETPLLPPLGSVAAAAIRILNENARRSGYPRNLILLGLDFQMLPGKTHARMAPFHRRDLASHNRFSPLGCNRSLLKRPTTPGDDRTGVTTRFDTILLHQAALLKEQVHAARRSITVYSAGEGAEIGALTWSEESWKKPIEGGASPLRRDVSPSSPIGSSTIELENLRFRLQECEALLTASIADSKPDAKALCPEEIWDPVILDFPDLGELNTQPSLRESQYPRILASIRDLRRRLTRSLV